MPDRRSNALRAGLLLLALLAAATGCRHLAGMRGREVPDCPGALVSTAAIPGDFLLRERVRVTANGSSWSLQLITQKRADELVMIGFDPLGVKLFTLTQRGTATTVDALPAPVLEVPPLNLLRDLHRIRFMGLEPAAQDGTRTGTIAEYAVSEQRAEGRLASRSFRRSADAPPEIEIRYSPRSEGGRARAALVNRACRYRAEFDTLETRGIQ
jgi:hypothetical protein